MTVSSTSGKTTTTKMTVTTTATGMRTVMMMTNTMTTTSRQRNASSTTPASRTSDSSPTVDLTRLVLIGAVAVFLSVFGLTVAASQVTGSGSGGGDEIVVQSSSGQPVRVAPHVRTRSS